MASVSDEHESSKKIVADWSYESCSSCSERLSKLSTCTHHIYACNCVSCYQRSAIDGTKCCQGYITSTNVNRKRDSSMSLYLQSNMTIEPLLEMVLTISGHQHTNRKEDTKGEPHEPSVSLVPADRGGIPIVRIHCRGWSLSNCTAKCSKCNYYK